MAFDKMIDLRIEFEGLRNKEANLQIEHMNTRILIDKINLIENIVKIQDRMNEIKTTLGV